MNKLKLVIQKLIDIVNPNSKSRDARFTYRVLKDMERKARNRYRTTQKVIKNRKRRVRRGDTIVVIPPEEPIPAIFECGGDFEESDGTCNDVIVACATIDIDFECKKEDEEGVCTNGCC